MIEALDQWRDRLITAITGLRKQNEMIADMDATATAMVESARSLNDMFTDEADRIGDFVRNILLLGATFGLLLGSGTRHSSSRARSPGRCNDLQQSMRELARDPLAGPITASERRDELGDMARAANFFVTEIGLRETCAAPSQGPGRQRARRSCGRRRPT